MPKHLQAPEQFAIQRVSFAFLKGTHTDTQALLMDRAAWTLWIGQKYYRRATFASMQQQSYAEVAIMRRCTYCNRVHVLSECPGCGSPLFQAWSTEKLPTGQQELFLEWDEPLVIANQIDFWVDITLLERLPGPLHMRCWLSGLHLRGVA